jgi:hypothetical protein
MIDADIRARMKLGALQKSALVQSRGIAKERINAAWLAGGINGATLAATWTVVSAIGAKEAGIETQLKGMTREELIAWDANEAWA